jgi:hypothetical protein
MLIKMSSTAKHFLLLLIFAAFIAIVHLLVIVPYVQRTALPARYSRQKVAWIDADGTVNANLSDFVSARYVTTTDDGSLKRLSCDRYLHLFPFTDSGEALVVSMKLGTPSWTVDDRKFLPYFWIKDLVLKDYVQECVESVDDWRKLFRSVHVERRNVSALKRFTYDITFSSASGSNDPPTTLDESVMRLMDRPNLLTFTFRDTITNEVFRFQLEGYKPSSFAGTAPNKTGSVDERLPELSLDRMDVNASLSETAVLLTRHGTIDGLMAASDDQRSINPCWDPKYNRFQVGNFAVTLDQFSTIYLRGLQRVTDDDASRDPKINETLQKMFWGCTYDIKGGGTGSGSERGGSGVVKTLVDTDRYAIVNRNSILNDTLLTLNLCLEGKKFDGTKCR